MLRASLTLAVIEWIFSLLVIHTRTIDCRRDCFESACRFFFLLFNRNFCKKIDLQRNKKTDKEEIL